MPHTINGIGTTYYGNSNSRVRVGPCEACGKVATLSSYDTRYWFVVVFIPVIPLGKKRIIDQCGVCRRHRVMDLREWEAARAKAMEEGMRKVVDHPGDLEALTALHGTCLFFGEWEKADQLGDRIEKEFPDDPKAHLHVASAHAYRGRGDQVEKSLARAHELDPAIAPPAPSAESSRPKRPGSSRRQKILLGIFVLLVLGVAVLVDQYEVHHRTLHVVNGYGAPLTVKIPEVGDLDIPPLSRRTLELPEGKYTARVTGALAADLPFEMSSSMIVRNFKSPLFILNPGGVAIILREDTVYGSKSDNGTISVHYGRPFLTFENIDYPFQDFPRQISVKSSESKRRRRLEHYTKPAIDVFNFLIEGKRANEGLALAEWAIDSHPARSEFLAAYAEAGADPAHREQVRRGLQGRLGRRPVDIPLHRAYQDLSRHSDPRGLLAEYEPLLKADPGNSALLYLRGRLAPGIAESAGYFDRSVAADPGNAYAHFALAYGRMSRGEWKEALASNARACELAPENSAFREQLDEVRMGLGQLELLEKELRERCKKEPGVASASLDRLVGLVALRNDCDAAFALCEEFRRIHGARDAWGAQIVEGILRCRAHYAAGNFSALEAEAAKGLKDSLNAYQIIARIELGRLDEAEALVAADDTDAFGILARSIAWFLKGDAVKADELRMKAADLLKAGSPGAANVASLLTAGKAPSLLAVMDVEGSPHEKAILLTACAQAYPELAGELRPRAQALNISTGYPRHLLRRALEKKP